MKTEQMSFQATQQQFCDWIRSPQSELPKSLPAERMQIYRDLLFNNVCSFIDLVYPITRVILPELQWQMLLTEFFQKAKCDSPFYNDISLQFREYLTDCQHPSLQEYPWLAELLQFEWLELYLDTVEIEKITATWKSEWQLNTQVWVLVYQYPVYQWSTSMTISEIELIPSVIMVWRNDQDHICVESLSVLFAVVIEQLNQQELVEQDIKKLIKATFPDFSNAQIQRQIDELKVLLTRLKLLDAPNKNDEEKG
ncbi:putative DNA-binding domain protein [compost metagenome]